MATEADYIQEYVAGKERTKICQEHITRARDEWESLSTSQHRARAPPPPPPRQPRARAPRPTPPPPRKGELFSGPVTDYTTIEKLNNYIATIMKDNLKTEAETKVEGPISDTLSSLCSGSLDDFQTRVCGWSRMKSSGNEFDCLIHSFLTMVSNEFRRLPESQKDNIASAFRRRLFLQFPAVERSADREAVKKQIPASHVFLTDSELQILSITYKINIIVFEQEKAEKIQQKTLKMPATITPFDNFKDSTTFYLLSEMDKHYEAVKANDSYMISRDTMEMILQKFPQDFTGEAKPSCKYPGTNRDIQEGDIVLYKKSPCMVLEKRYSGDPPSCKKLRVQMLDTDEEQEILTNEISEFNSSGGRRTARTQKKRHSYRRRRWYSVVASTRNRKQRTTRRKV